MKKEKAVQTAAVCLATVFLGGCAGEQVDYVEEPTESTTADSSCMVERFADETEWESKWIIENENGEVNITVHAQIQLPETETMSVIEIKMSEITAETKEALIGSLFDESDVYYADEQTDYEINDIIDYDLDDYTLASDYEADAYVGWNDGNQYYLKMVQNGSNAYITYYPLDNRAYAPDEFAGVQMLACGEDSTSYDASNECVLSGDEAVELGEQFLAAIGLDNQVCYETYPLVWTAGVEQVGENVWETQEITDGYVLYFRKDVDEAVYDVLYSDVRDSDVDLRESGYASTSYIVLYVNACGVFEMRIENDYEIAGITEQVGLLSLSSVEDIISSELTEHTADYYDEDGSYSYDTLELQYVPVADRQREGYYSYVPAWVLSGDGYSNFWVYVNAIDGSIIDYADVMM